MRRRQDTAIGTLGQRGVEQGASPVSTANPGGRARSKSNDWDASAQQSFTPAMLLRSAGAHRLITQVDPGSIRNVVDQDGPGVASANAEKWRYSPSCDGLV